MNLYYKISFLSVFFTLSVTLAQAGQVNTIIRGEVLDEYEQPVSGINISLKDTRYGTATLQDGTYEINNVPAGQYTLVASGIGFESLEKVISVETGQYLVIDILLSVSAEELQEIVVKNSRINKFTEEWSPYVGKMPIEKINNPQVYNSITSELLADQVVIHFDEALKNAPGIFKLWESTGRGGDGAGYYSLRGFPVQPTMVNGLPSLTYGTLDPANVKSIEVIKGPSGTLYGSSLISYGGLINVVTKKPYQRFGGEVSYKTGSYGLNRITADVNTPIGQELALRVNSSYHTQNSFQDAGFSESFFVAPALQYEAGESLSFLVNTEYYHSESTNPTMLFLNRSTPLVASNPGELNYNSKLSYTSNGLTIENPAYKLQGEMRYQLSDSWVSQTALSRSSAKADGYYSYLWDIADGNGTYTRYISKQNSTTLGTDIQQNFTGNFSVAGIKNRIVLGVDYFEQRAVNNNTGYIGFDEISLQDPSTSAISGSAVESELANAALVQNTTEQQVYSAYASNVFEFIPQLSAMASVRIDRFNNRGDVLTDGDDFSQTSVSPKFGVVFQPVKDKVSLFANYMNGFSNVAPRVQDDGSLKNFSPERANQWESGMKANLANGRFSGTISYYTITVSDVVRQDPERVNYFIQDGENFSRGIEASITTFPVAGLNITAGYSHNESEVVKTDSEEYLGRRPESAGPKDLINGWISYEFSSGSLDGFGAGFGGNYSGENKIMNRQSTGMFILPAYTILDASLFYNNESYRLDLKVNNLTDQEYFKGWSTVNPQLPRTVTASFSYKF